MILESAIHCQEKYPSIGAFVRDFSSKNPQLSVLAEKKNGDYQSVLWSDFYKRIQTVMAYLLEMGVKKGEHLVFYSPNCREMLEMELACKSLGLVSIPLFYGYKEKRVNELLEFTDGDYLVVYDEKQLARVDEKIPFKLIIQFRGDIAKNRGVVAYEEIIHRSSSVPLEAINKRIDSVGREDHCLMMYTSGTMGFPKGVQLRHGNILSQQEALDILWKTEKAGKILSYLPWHHSFGGIFEKYFALYSGTTMILDDSLGKDIDLLLSNYRLSKPNYFFSVPKVFYEIVSRCSTDTKIDADFFHSDLRFVFTAGAPLAGSVSDVFKHKKIPVLEGWGLTETSPCCTLTDGVSERLPGIVGKPIPGVRITQEEDGEILVSGPNIMSGYFKNPESNKKAFTDDKIWFKTGDIGEIVNGQVKILTRKDRIFKLANAEKVNPTLVENNLLGRCNLLKYVLVFGSGMEQVSALIFPNNDSLCSESRHDLAHCANPKDVHELSSCLRKCIDDLNQELKKKYESIGTFIILNKELDIEKGELTPSMKVNPQNVLNNYATYIEPLKNPKTERPSDAIYIQIKDNESLIKNSVLHS